MAGWVVGVNGNSNIDQIATPQPTNPVIPPTKTFAIAGCSNLWLI